ncbi:MAG: O-antigen ligase family protein [Chloroflexota bacterium]
MKLFARAILRVEPLLLAIVVASFWFPDSYRVNVLLLLIPPALARLILYRRLWVNTPLNLFFYAFLLLCIANTAIAQAHPGLVPYSWGWYELGRPIMGIALALSMISIAYERKRIDGMLLVVLLVSLLVGVLGLVSAQYIGKSDQLQFLIDLVPKYIDFPGAVGGFNVNEIGGAMAFFAPFTAGIAIYAWRKRDAPLLLILSTVAFAILAHALALGQSRFALIGVLLTIGALIFLLIPTRRWRYATVAVWLVICLLEVGIVLQVFVPKSSASGVAEAAAVRDESSLAQRPVIWGAALGIIRDYPLTGAGLNEFRSRLIRAKYPVPNFAMTVVPHAHNELLQVGTDAGIPGMILYIGWHIALAWMVWRAWRKGDPLIKAAAAAAAAGLIAHAVFGLGDAITMYDRFAFAYWLFVGLAGGAYVLARRPPETAAIPA